MSSAVTVAETTTGATRSDEAFDYLFKVVLIGDSSVGKTCIVQRFKHGTYVEKHGNTIGVDFTIKTIDVDGKKVKVTRAELQSGSAQYDQSRSPLCNGDKYFILVALALNNLTGLGP